MVEDAKEPQGGGVTTAPGDVGNQGVILSYVLTSCYYESRGGTSDFGLRNSNFPISEFRLRTSDFKLSDFGLPTSDFLDSSVLPCEFKCFLFFSELRLFRILQRVRPQTSPQTNELVVQ